MERFILKYPNGKVRQQKGINGTYYYLLGVGAISWIIDTKKGEILFSDKDENVITDKITTYTDSDMIVPKN